LTVLGKNYVFVHIYKTGGMSIRSMLPDGEYVFRGHATAREVRGFIGERKWGELYSFGFVRNPFTWMISLYEFIKADRSHRHHATVRTLSFDQFLWFARQKVAAGEYYTLTQALCDDSGVPLVTRVGRFEAFEEEVADIFRELGRGRVKVLSVNRGRRVRVDDYYRSQPAVDLVLKTFGKDFEVFGYNTTPPREEAQTGTAS
jgi:hypothetical protein